MPRSPRSSTRANIAELVEQYRSQQELVRRFLGQIQGYVSDSNSLGPLIHGVRARMKDPEHLHRKLERNGCRAAVNGRQTRVTKQNLLRVVNDLAGIRILHLYPEQFYKIDEHLRAIFKEESLTLVEGPIAKTWDDDTRNRFLARQIAVAQEPSMYTSVHYVVGSASQVMVTCEIQVRTLIEETWGELSHSINYPSPSPDSSFDDELRVLARIGSSALRMVECIQARHGRSVAAATGVVGKKARAPSRAVGGSASTRRSSASPSKKRL